MHSVESCEDKGSIRYVTCMGKGLETKPDQTSDNTVQLTPQTVSHHHQQTLQSLLQQLQERPEQACQLLEAQPGCEVAVSGAEEAWNCCQAHLAI